MFQLFCKLIRRDYETQIIIGAELPRLTLILGFEFHEKFWISIKFSGWRDSTKFNRNIGKFWMRNGDSEVNSSRSAWKNKQPENDGLCAGKFEGKAEGEKQVERRDDERMPSELHVILMRAAIPRMFTQSTKVDEGHLGKGDEGGKCNGKLFFSLWMQSEMENDDARWSGWDFVGREVESNESLMWSDEDGGTFDVHFSTFVLVRWKERLENKREK